MATKDSLGDRMKSYYEDRYRINLPRRTNIVIRIDGKAFHTYTKGLQRPYDIGLSDDMDATTKFLCENIQGAKMGYVQSDEISIVLHDYNDLSTDGWFDFNLQKMCSIASSLATAKFNQRRLERLSWKGPDAENTLDQKDLQNFKLAMFDARVFVIPEPEEVVNYFLWRQQDATRNSISMAAQSMFSHKELQKKSSDEMQELMFTLKGVNWNDYPTRFKRGGAVVKTEQHFMAKDFKFKNDGKTHVIDPDKIITRRAWTAVDTPIFSQDRNFILNVLKRTLEHGE